MSLLTEYQIEGPAQSIICNSEIVYGTRLGSIVNMSIEAGYNGDSFNNSSLTSSMILSPDQVDALLTDDTHNKWRWFHRYLIYHTYELDSNYSSFSLFEISPGQSFRVMSANDELASAVVFEMLGRVRCFQIGLVLDH